jgi:hypothetical protein
MAEFNLAIDRKVTVWNREHHCVEANSQEEAIEKLRTHILEDDSATCDLSSYTCELETLLDTEEKIAPEDNNGQSTIEIVNMSNGGSVLWSNETKPESNDEQT